MSHKILHFVNTFIPTYGGKTNRIYNLSRNDNCHHIIHVPFPSDHGSRAGNFMEEREQIENITIKRHRLNGIPDISFPIIDYIIRVLSTKKKVNQVYNWVQEDDINVVYGHTPLEYGLAALSLSKKRRVPFIYEAHGLIYDNLWVPQERIAYLYHRIMQQFFVSSEKRILHTADIVIAQTHSIKGRISDIYGINPDNIMVIYNGVDDKTFDPNNVIQKAKEYRDQRCWSEKIVIMYSGFLDSINGVDFLLQAIKKIPKHITDRIKLVLLGRGHFQSNVEEASKKYPFIDYVGIVNYDQMPVLYGCADIFVIPRPSTLPSETLLPVKLLEAMAMEKVVLVSDVGGMTEIVEDQKNGLLFRKGNMEDFLSKLMNTIGDIYNMKQIGIRARRTVISNYSWAKSRESLRWIYQCLISKYQTSKVDKF